jgi:ATP-dependent RNA helicase RhlE
MLRALEGAGYGVPTPIQAGTIAPALQGRDVIGVARTGTGKTAAFLIPIIERLRDTRDCALILAPTRELAEQIVGWSQRLGGGLRTALIVGGVGYGPQIQALRRGVSILVATPGRLVDHLDRGTASLKTVRCLVLDEADRMLDMGFKPQLDRILAAVPTPRQTFLFSATLPASLGALTRMHLQNPVRVVADRASTPPARAAQDAYLVAGDRKADLLLAVLAEHAGSALVFTRTKHRADRVAKVVRNAGHAAQRIHSGRSQSQRREALEGFRRGQYRVLIATDIAARGIDVIGIERVINFDLPHTVDDYIHRIGRTARAEASGRASSFASPEEREQLRAIERHLGSALPRCAHDTQTPVRSVHAPSHPRVERVAPRPNRPGRPTPPRRAREARRTSFAQ